MIKIILLIIVSQEHHFDVHNRITSTWLSIIHILLLLLLLLLVAVVGRLTLPFTILRHTNAIVVKACYKRTRKEKNKSGARM